MHPTISPNARRLFLPACSYGTLDDVVTFPGRMYAFVNYRTTEEALRAVAALQDRAVRACMPSVGAGASQIRGPVAWKLLGSCGRGRRPGHCVETAGELRQGAQDRQPLSAVSSLRRRYW